MWGRLNRGDKNSADNFKRDKNNRKEVKRKSKNRLGITKEKIAKENTQQESQTMTKGLEV